MNFKNKGILVTSLSVLLATLVACGTSTTSNETTTGSTTTTTTTTTTTSENTAILELDKDQTSLLDFSKLEDGKAAFVKGVVYSKARSGKSGYWIADLTSSSFVYAPGDDVNIGEVVVIYASKSTYFGLSQINYNVPVDAIEKIGTTTYRPAFAKATIRGLYDFTTAPDVKLFSQNITVEGKVIGKVEDFMTNFYIQDPITGHEIKVDYNGGENFVGLHKDKFIEIDVTTYGYNDTTKVWSVYVDGVAPRIVEKASPTLTTEEKLDSVANVLLKKYNNITIYRDIEFILTDSLFATNITYVSSNIGVLTNDGVITTPSETTSVNVTANITLSGASKEVVLIIKVASLKVTPLATVLATFEQQFIESPATVLPVATTGVVTGTRGGTGYWIQDGSNAVYVKGNKLGFKVGDTVNVVGNLKYNKQPLIDTIEFEEISTNKIALPSALAVKITDLLANDELKVSSFSKYIKLTGKLIVEAGSYGNTYKLQDIDVPASSVLIHSASNTSGFTALKDKTVTIKCFVQDYNKGFRIFTTNRDDELNVLGADEDKLAIASAYLDTVMPLQEEIITSDIDLTTTHIALADAKYVWSSSNEKVMTSTGKNLHVATESNVTLTCKVSVGTKEVTKSYSYNIAAGKSKGNANDLMFTTVMRGAKNDKLICITNMTGSTISLAKYKVYSVQNSGLGSNSFDINGSNAQGILELGTQDSLASKETLILYHDQAEATLIANIPSTSKKIACPNQNGVVAINGSDGDMVYLMKGSYVVDKIGTVEKVASQGQPTSWETEYFSSNSMIVRTSIEPTPSLDWRKFDDVNTIYKRLPAIGAGTNYKIPEFIYNWASFVA
ncbi:MAG: hypothetical protein RR909_02875 [Bacilli bacterium]